MHQHRFKSFSERYETHLVKNIFRIGIDTVTLMMLNILSIKRVELLYAFCIFLDFVKEDASDMHVSQSVDRFIFGIDMSTYLFK